jgi:uncharacterized protein (TIGR02145 family)
MKEINKLVFIAIFLCSFQTALAQSANVLLGNIYEKAASSTNRSTLYFSQKNSGRLNSTLEFNGREINTSASFTYLINGSRVQITYEKDLGTEVYDFDGSASQLISPNMQGYVNGKLEKVIWNLKVGAGTPGRVEGSNYAFNQEKKPSDGKILIGSQIWAGENLNVSTFRNGDVIPEAKTNEEWIQYLNNGMPAWCYYLNNLENGKMYGKLYNWYAFNDPRGLAPIGWKIPNHDDWKQLTTKLGGGSIYSREANAMKARGMWAESSIAEETNFSNTSGFTALPSGYRKPDGAFEGIKFNGVWWIAGGKNIGMAYNSHSTSEFSFLSKKSGLSVRLIQENSTEIKNIFTDPIINNRNLIGTPIVIGNIEFSENDFESELDFRNAIDACASLGDGWRLPTIDELYLISSNKSLFKNLMYDDYYYWSSTVNNFGEPFVFYFIKKQPYESDSKGYAQKVLKKSRVRPVRTIRKT